jgi:ribosomal-protein-alanine N-acetyltransferase
VDPDVRRYLFDDESVERDWVEREIEASARNFESHRYGLWALYEPGGSDLVGFTGLRVFHGADEPQLLYGLDPAVWGRGYATEAAAGVLTHAFDELRVDRVLASTDPPNKASLAVMRRLGMRRLEERTVDGRPTIYYEIRRAEWRHDPS